jgi:hypothetical protein
MAILSAGANPGESWRQVEAAATVGCLVGRLGGLDSEPQGESARVGWGLECGKQASTVIIERS